MPKKKNAKQGGIAAAVTKQTAGKFATIIENNSDSSQGQTGPDVSSSPPAATPEIRPAVPEPYPEPEEPEPEPELESDLQPESEPEPEVLPDNGNPQPSPILDALSTTSAVSASTIPSMMNDWRAGMAGSPGNLINLTSESPPTQPSSYEDSGRLHHGWSAQRAFMTPSPASPSPPTNYRRPLSFQMEAQHASPDALGRVSNTGHHRRSSLHSQFSHARTGSHPPLPHQPQAHFYEASDLDLTLKPQSGMKAGDQGLYFGFDKLPTSTSTADAEDVVLAGYQGGLEVLGVTKRGLEHLGSLKGLRGGVHYAKILPWTAGGEKTTLFPLVAVVLHGPVLPSRNTEAGDQDGDAATRADGAASPRSVYTHQDPLPARSVVEAYQTSVEVYSLRTNKRVDILLQTPSVPINTEISLTSPLFQPPQPVGAFTIKADGGIVAICSGATGECWIYFQLLEPQNDHLFACTAKVWTTVQQGQRGDVSEEAEKSHSPTIASRPNSPTAIFALGGRKIAYCPAAPSSQISLRAHLPVPILGRGPGVASLTPPHLPQANLSVDLPISGSVVNKIMRETTQELIQGAKWVGQQGLQAWNSYWNRSTSPQAQPQARSPPSQWVGARSPRNEASQFPPTHGAAGQTLNKDPGLVSILEADSLVTSPSIHLLTSFAAPEGCSFLSFSPSGLCLFTASSKGDVQTVWDLLRTQHTHSTPLQASISQNDSLGPQVRQIAQFSRMTVARIVEVAWIEPQGERIAMVTERGTVHMLDMPFSAFMWPPPRRRKVAQKPATEASEPSSSAVSIASGAFGAAYQAAKPFVTRSRQGSNNSSTTAGSLLKDSAAQGGRVLAASISSSIGKTGSAINQLRHTGENRVSLPPSSALPSSACVTWIKSRRTVTLFTVGGGLVRSYPLRTRRSSSQGKRISRANKYKDFRAPLLPDDIVAPAIRQILDLGAQDEQLDLSDAEMEVGGTLLLKNRSRIPPILDHAMGSTIPQAEIECSAPYQPFHTDRRVALCEYTGSDTGLVDRMTNLVANAALDDRSASKKKGRSSRSGGKTAMSAWAFGQDIPVVKLDLGLPLIMDDEEFGDAENHRALPPSAMERVMEYGDSEQIVVTTRRRRGANQGEDGDGFFEDDCEVLDFADQRV